MRLPLLFREFDADAEFVTIHILEALSRFENISDLPKETIKAILLNDALRQRIASEHDINKQIELIREALIEENRNASLRLKAAGQEMAGLAEGLSQQQRSIVELTQTVEAQGRQLDAANQLAENLRSEITQLKEKHASKDVRRRFILKFDFVPLLLISVLVPILTAQIAEFGTARFYFYAVVSWCAFLAALVWVMDRKGAREPSVTSWTSYRWLHRVRKYMYGALILPMPSRIAWEVAKYSYERVAR